MIIPWYEKPADPDAWHRVRAPGGYEWWYFEAHDSGGDTHVVAVFYDGFVFHEEYVRRYARYRRRPTRNSPPVPRDFPCVSFAVYRGGKVLGRWVEEYPAGAFEGSTQKVEVVVGRNRLSWEDDRLAIRVSDTRLEGEFVFAPRWRYPAVERALFHAHGGGCGEHRWVIANPLCDVEGFFVKGGERQRFVGVGYHDHQFGTGPIGEAVGDWNCGRAYFGDRVYAFHYATCDADGCAAGETDVTVMCDAEGACEVRPKGHVRELRLSATRALDEKRVRMDAVDSRSREGVAFMESVCRSRERLAPLERLAGGAITVQRIVG